MKIGILNVLKINEDPVDWSGTPVDAYIRFLDRAALSFTYLGYDVTQGEFPESPEECDAYIITGSPNGVYDAEEWIGQLITFIRDSYQAGKKLVGICFGHQILAHALGGHSEKSSKGWGLGLKPFDITRKKPWMTGTPDSCSLYFVHQDQVVRLPPEAELLGGNDFCPNALFVIRDQVLGVQGHPEFTPDIMGDILSMHEIDIAGEVHKAAVYSCNTGTPDNQLMAQWIVNFLTATP